MRWMIWSNQLGQYASHQAASLLCERLGPVTQGEDPYNLVLSFTYMKTSGFTLNFSQRWKLEKKTIAAKEKNENRHSYNSLSENWKEWRIFLSQKNTSEVPSWREEKILNKTIQKQGWFFTLPEHVYWREWDFPRYRIWHQILSSAGKKSTLQLDSVKPLIITIKNQDLWVPPGLMKVLNYFTHITSSRHILLEPHEPPWTWLPRPQKARPAPETFVRSRTFDMTSSARNNARTKLCQWHCHTTSQDHAPWVRL